MQSGTRATQLRLFGQVNRALLRASDGGRSGTFFVDNANSSTRIGLSGEAAATRDLTLGSTIEFEIVSDSSRSVALPSDGSLGGAAFNDRRLEVFGRHARFGTVWLGQGHTASDGAAEVDLTKTRVVTSSDIPDLAGGIRFGGGGPRIRNVYTNLDGLGRDDRIRYDSPLFGGLQGSASYITGGGYDLAVRFRGRLDGTDVAGAAALANSGEVGPSGQEVYVASASANFRNGFSGAVATGREATGATFDAFFMYGKIAYETRLTQLGTTSFAADLAFARDVAATGDDFYAYGGYVVQRVDRAATDLYAGVRNHKLNRPSTTFEDILAVIVGARVRF